MKKQSPIHIKLCAFLTLLLTAAITAPTQAVITVDITEGYSEPLPIAIPAFAALSDATTPIGTVNQIGGNIADVISADLARSGLFAPLDPDSFISTPGTAEVRPRFANWRAIGSQALVTGQIAPEPDGRIRVEIRLWDVLSETQMTGMRYVVVPENWRRVAHLFADAIYRRLTGEAGYFDSRIVYIAETGSQLQRIKRLAIMDQDGENHRYLTDGRDLVLTPRFSPTRQEITYLAYYNNQPRVYLYNIDTGKHEVLGDFPNMTFAPRFSPDGNKVIMSLAESGNSDIYVMDLRTRQMQRLTTHPGIDTSPSYSPDGGEIVFNSDRGGSQQLYTMDADGSSVKRISFDRNGARYGTPVWSPRGDLIAFTKLGQGKFRIGVMETDGSRERLLTDAYQDEGPTWAPNGRVLIYFRQTPSDSQGRGGSITLWSIDLTGYNERPVGTPLEASDPAWSPLLR